MPCRQCTDPLQCDQRCREDQRVREIVRRAVLRMPRTQITTTIRQAELERFVGIVLEEARGEGDVEGRTA